MRVIGRQARNSRVELDSEGGGEPLFIEGGLSSCRAISVRKNGFTLIELMVVLVIIGILTAIALPAYDQYVKKGRAKSASSDLVALSLNLENAYQRTLHYPAETTTTTIGTQDLAPGWYPSEKKFFTYTVQSTAADYKVTATGIDGMSGCELSLSSANERTVSASGCGGMTSW